MRVIADSHALVWYFRQPQLLSGPALEALLEADRTDGVVVSVATYLDLWYAVRRGRMEQVALTHIWPIVRDPGPNFSVAAITAPVAERSTLDPFSRVADPWDRFIAATAAVRNLPLVTRDRELRDLGVIQTVW